MANSFISMKCCPPKAAALVLLWNLCVCAALWFNSQLKSSLYAGLNIKGFLGKNGVEGIVSIISLNRSAFTYWEENIPSRLDLGKSRFGGPFTTEQVEDVRLLVNC